MSDDLVSVQMSQPMCIMWAKDIKYLCDRIEELEAKLATCEKYRDAYAECDRIGTQVVRDLEAKLAMALEALEPFARAAETWEPDDGDSGLGARIEHPHHGLERHAEFTFGDLRRARTTLAELKEVVDTVNRIV